MICTAVGYQNIALADQISSAGFTWLIGTLPSVGKDHNAVTLNDFKVVAPADGLMGENSVNVHTYDASGMEVGNYSYVDEVAINNNWWTDENGELIAPGWYTTGSLQGLTAAYPEPAGTTTVPFGEGFMVISDCGADITFAGEVYGRGKDIALNDQISTAGFTWTGNCSPVSIQLKDVGITAPVDGLMGENSVNVHTYGNTGMEVGNYSYVDEVAINNNWWTDEFGELIVPGWYTTGSLQGLTAAYPEPAGTVTLNAGEMFMVISDCGATMTIPSAL